MIKADPKEFLSKLYRNFHILQERQAKYAGNSPLELINQIDDHKTAIYLTKQAIEDSLSEEEWREALEPLLLAVNNSREIIVVQSPYRDEHYRTALNWDGRTRLREFDLAGRDLSAMDFTDADLTKANLSKSNPLVSAKE